MNTRILPFPELHAMCKAHGVSLTNREVRALAAQAQVETLGFADPLGVIYQKRFAVLQQAAVFAKIGGAK